MRAASETATRSTPTQARKSKRGRRTSNITVCYWRAKNHILRTIEAAIPFYDPDSYWIVPGTWDEDA